MEKILALLAAADTFAAIDALHEPSADPNAIAKAYSELVLHLYWQQKDLSAAISMARAGIQYCLHTAAYGNLAPDAAEALRGSAKAIAYNLGSFCWPGWDEPGIAVDATALYFGRDAARLNLRLAQELGRGDLPLTRAHWLLGAHHLAAGDTDQAKQSFEASARHAGTAEARAEELLAQGFALLSTLLGQSTEDSHLRTDLNAIKAQLAELENGDEFVKQIDTAGRIFDTRVSKAEMT